MHLLNAYRTGRDKEKKEVGIFLSKFAMALSQIQVGSALGRYGLMF